MQPNPARRSPLDRQNLHHPRQLFTPLSRPLPRVSVGPPLPGPIQNSYFNENDGSHVHHTPSTSPGAKDYHSIPNYSPNLFKPAKLPSNPRYLVQELSLCGAPFVSFCRALLSTQNGPAVFHRRAWWLHLEISFVEPDSGRETPFTLVELLSAIRLLCGTLNGLDLKAVNLPIPTETPSTSLATRDHCDEFK